MTNESLSDLVETRSAEHRIPRHRLWGLAFAAILDGSLVPANPSDLPLDTEFDHGGMRLTWRRVIARQARAIDQAGANPSGWSWTRATMFSPAEFDKWLKRALRNNKFPPRPKRSAGAKPTLREKIKEFVDDKYPEGLPTGVTYKDVAKAAERTVGRIVDVRTVSRALGGK